MTVERMIELLEIEKECVLRNASGECNRYCAGCELLQDDTELHEMYTEAIALLKAQEPGVIKNSAGNGICPGCGHIIPAWSSPNIIPVWSSPNYCGYCGQAVKWE